MNRDAHWMQQALVLAQKGRFTTRPNPCVGCVIVQDDQCIAKGWHQYAGADHAEAMALKQAGLDAAGSTVYVTLEPCSHHGRTGPCCEALIAAGVGRVVIAVVDPNPQVNHQGIQRLRDAGIEVEVGVLTEPAQQLNQGFLFAMTNKRPWVRCKMAMSVDGRTAMASGESQWITGSEARLDGQKLRAMSGAIITGIGTVLADDPALTVRPESWCEEDVPDVAIPAPIRVVVDRRGRLPLDAAVLEGPGDVWWVYCQADVDKVAVLQQRGVRCLSYESGAPFFHLLLAELYAAGVYDVMLEMGGRLSAAWIEAGLVDELWLYMAPKLLGVEAQGLFELRGISRLNQAIEWQTQSVRCLGQDVCWQMTRASG